MREKGEYLLEMKYMKRSVVSRLVHIFVEPAYEMNESLKIRHNEEECSVSMQIKIVCFVMLTLICASRKFHFHL